MSRTPRPTCWPGALTQDTMSADICPVDQLSFWRVVKLPYPAWLAALDHWRLIASGTELWLGSGVLRGPAGHDPHFGTCHIQARLGRGPLRPPLRMRLEIDRWSPTATALTLIPCQRAWSTTSYFRAGQAAMASQDGSSTTSPRVRGQRPAHRGSQATGAPAAPQGRAAPAPAHRSALHPLPPQPGRVLGQPTGGASGRRP
jgi:hypothetical protein